ncbi:MAG: right-handed parallel beta-helix repeat-containing protein [Acidimicrobiales bacterium]
MPAPATSGTPLVRQVRNGEVIATYDSIGAGTSGDGPFARTHVWNKIQPGDVFEVYPAVYTGPGQLPWIGPLPDESGTTHTPTDVTIRGITVNGERPVLKMGTTGDYNTLGHGLVEIDGVDGLTWENIDIDGTDGEWVDRAAIYVLNSNDVTIRNARIHGMQDSRHNGVFGAGGNRGTLLLDNLRLYDNGGDNGPSHNVYVNSSDTDPDFTLAVRNSWSSAVNLGHLLKSRAQVTVVEGNLLEGTNPLPGWDCGESYGLDVPNGGRVTVTNNVFVKAKPEACGNGISFRYGAEGLDAGRTHRVDLVHNTFIARSPVWDEAGHRSIPLGFFSPLAVPGTSGALGVPIEVSLNRFEGYVTDDLDAAARYRGTDYVDIPGTLD